MHAAITTTKCVTSVARRGVGGGGGGGGVTYVPGRRVEGAPK